MILSPEMIVSCRWWWMRHTSFPTGDQASERSMERWEYFARCFRKEHLNLGNDRPNVSLAVRAIQNPMNTYSDLEFLIPKGIRRADEVPKGFIELRGTGLIRPYNAGLSKECRDLVMGLFKAGIVRILVCTDAAGMVGFFRHRYCCPVEVDGHSLGFCPTSRPRSTRARPNWTCRFASGKINLRC